MDGGAAAGRSGWLRALGLLGATGFSSVVNPGVLIAVPFCLLVLFLPPRRVFVLILGVAAAGLVAVGGSGSGFWYVERGWALLLGGWFLALTIRWPRERFFPRGLGAVLGSFLGMSLLFRVRPGDWTVLDWAVKSRIDFEMGLALETFRGTMGSGGNQEVLEAAMMDTFALYRLLFPALLGLASLAALGLAWWVFKKMSDSPEEGPEEGIGPLRDFRFNAHLIWILIFGVMALLASSGALEQVGTNAVVFMGALYALRGAGVLLALTGGPSFLGVVALLLGFMLMAPILIMGAFFCGLGDTWFDFRARLASARPEA